MVINVENFQRSLATALRAQTDASKKEISLVTFSVEKVIG